MYKELEEKLGEKLDEVTSYYSMAREGLEGWHDSLANGPGEAQGKIVTDFINKEAYQFTSLCPGRYVRRMPDHHDQDSRLSRL